MGTPSPGWNSLVLEARRARVVARRRRRRRVQLGMLWLLTVATSAVLGVLGSLRLRVPDASSGLSYRLLGSPWLHGCPSDLNNSQFDWTAGENTVAGNVSMGGS